MFTLKIQNANNQIFELSHNTRNYAVVGVQGLTPPPTAVNTSTGGILDGTFHNSSRVEQRNIVIDIVLNGDIETNRQRLYQMFPRKLPCTIFFKNKNRDVKIIGYVEALEGDLFTQREQMQISIICPRPFWESLNAIYTELSQIVKLFEFPFSILTPIPFSELTENPLCTITNDGDVECGCIMTISIKDDVTGLTIYDRTKQQYFGINYTFQAQDTITINTVSGQMGVSLNRDGETTNLLNYVTAGSSWFKLSTGNNVFTFRATTGGDSVEITFATAILYGGV